MTDSLNIRPYREGEEQQLWRIFFDTVRNVNVQDYSQSQVNLWAPYPYQPKKWQKKVKKLNPFVALKQDVIVGYADLQKEGKIDHFYCHHNYQRKGIGSALMKRILEEAKRKKMTLLYSNVSITARPFFEANGFVVITKQEVAIKDQTLINYRMERSLTKENTTS